MFESKVLSICSLGYSGSHEHREVLVKHIVRNVTYGEEDIVSLETFFRESL